MKIQRTAASQARVDAFMNLVTGLGDPGRDKRLQASVAPADLLDWATLENLYVGDSIAAKIVDTLPEDMTREWITFTQGDDAMAEKAVMQKLRKMKVQSAFEWALKMSRLHGGAVIVMGINDGRKFDQPLDENAIRSFNFVNVLDRWQIYPTTRLYRDPTRPEYNTPEYYRLQPALHSQAVGEIVHASRLLRFDGVRLPDRTSLRNLGWGDSVLNRLYRAILAYHTAHDNANLIIQDFANGVYTIKGLSGLLASGEDGVAAVITRLQQVDLAKSVVRSMILDEDEDYKKLSTNVSGLEKLIEAAERRLVTESGMPHTKLLGEAPGASLGEGGDSQNRDWYDHVAAKQESLMRDPLERLIELMLKSQDGPTGGEVPDEWSIGFNSLWQMDESKVAQNRLWQAQADEIYLQNKVTLPAEIAKSRFGGAGYSSDTVIDVSLRDQLGKYEGGDEPLGEAPDV